MQGDSSDTIPGIGGLGEKGAAEFLAQYGSVYNFLDLAKRNELPNRLPAAHRRLRDNEPPSPSKKYGQMLPLQDAFERNMQLMDLSRAPKIEPNGINKASGVLNEEAFGLFCQQHFFNSIIGDPRWLDPFRAGV